jgi:outer membrane lipoprotein-sorting protein
VKRLRTLPTSRLLVLIFALLVVSAGGAALAVAATGDSGPTPPPKPLAQALHDAAAATAPAGITARITFTNKLFPSGALVGAAGSSLMSGASGRLWVTADGHGRIELQSDAGDAQIVWSPTEVTIYDASSNTVYKAALPAAKDGATPDKGALPSVSQISDFLTKAGADVSVSDAQPIDVAGRAAYGVTVAPKHDGGLLGSVELAWDAENGVPLRAAVYAQGASSPVLSLAVTDISYGPVSAGDVDMSPPAGAKVVDLGTAGHNASSTGDKGTAPVTGFAAVQAAAGFPVAAPGTLVGLPLKDVRLVGGKSVVVVYGQGLGAIAVLERKADATAPKGGTLSALPTVSLDGVTAHELATQLGTVIEWQSGGVDYVLAGSLPSAAAEAAARALK